MELKELKETSQRFLDPSTFKKSIDVRDNLKLYNGIPIFSLVEFNIYGNCNRNCSFCPVSNPDVYERRFEGIKPELYKKIIYDLKDISYDGNILFSAFSEPTLHKELNLLIEITKEILPNCRLEMVSNGDTIKRNSKKLMSYFDSGIDKISFSLYDGPDQMDHFIKMRDDIGVSEERMVLRRRYFQDGNYGMTISNRAGLIDSNEYRDESEQEIKDLPLKSSCYYPSYMLLIDYNGDVILCPHDWEKKYKSGSVKEKHLWEVWSGKKFEIARKKLSACDRRFAPCASCDVKGDVMGGESFEAWNEYYKS